MKLNIAPLTKLLGLGSLALLTSCSRYQISVNEQVVYEPAPLFSAYEIADKALAECVAQNIEDQKASQAQQLKRLDCSNAGIKSLEGLQVFKYLEKVNLADNYIQSLVGLHLGSQLKRLVLTGNSELACSQLEQARQWQELELSPPKHCLN